MVEGVTAVLFEGSQPLSEVEKMMAGARQAALLDNLEKMSRVGYIAEIILHTNRQELLDPAGRLGAEVVLNSTEPGAFHFGRELRNAIVARGLKKVFCLNGAGCPLVTVDELDLICRRLLERSNYVYTNNTQSSDMVAFTVPAGLATAELPAIDNSLALFLRDELGLDMELMPHSLGLLFDLDTPSDLLVLGAGPFCGPRVRAVLDSFSLDYRKLERAKAVLNDEYEEVALVGRVGAPVIGRLNAVLKLRLRVFSEERGMKALGRTEAGEVISLLGLLIDHCGLERFFHYLSRVARCAFIDSRVLFSHYRFNFTDRERFLSDLGCWEEIDNSWLREFTRLAEQCRIPVILGGHSLVSGSLWALCEELGPAASGGNPPRTAGE